MKLSELRVDRLKREFGKLELPTAGTKNELQRRLRRLRTFIRLKTCAYKIARQSR